MDRIARKIKLKKQADADHFRILPPRKKKGLDYSSA